MKILETSKLIEREFCKLFNRHKSLSMAVAWASVGFEAFDLVVSQKEKIVRAVIGTHFYQTHPKFIAQFVGDNKVKFMDAGAELFHPKIYIFQTSAEDWAVIIGSANFTRAGFTANDEVSMVFYSKDDPNSITKLKIEGVLDRYWQGKARVFSRQDLENYTFNFSRFQSRMKPFGLGQLETDNTEGRVPSQIPVAAATIQKMSWREYYAHVSQEKHFNNRKQVLSQAATRFRDFPKFAAMSTDHQKLIAAVKTNDDGLDWAIFGTNRYLTINWKNFSIEKLSSALDAIPITGPVKFGDYKNYVKRYVEAGLGDGIAGLTRFATMKRPDYFFCLNNANRPKLMSLLNLDRIDDRPQDFWVDVIVPLRNSVWYQSACPINPSEKAVWDGRMAFVDSLTYEGEN